MVMMVVTPLAQEKLNGWTLSQPGNKSEVEFQELKGFEVEAI